MTNWKYEARNWFGSSIHLGVLGKFQGGCFDVLKTVSFFGQTWFLVGRSNIEMNETGFSFVARIGHEFLPIPLGHLAGFW